MFSLYGLVILVGLVVGSFLNVCIYRIPRGQSVVYPRSSCPNCNSPIRILENIPILSYLVLRGKCRQCGTKISWIYPLVEGLTAILFCLLFIKYALLFPFFLNAIFFSILVILIFIDLSERLLPDICTLGGVAFGFVMAPLQSGEFFSDVSLINLQGVLMRYCYSLLGILMGAGILWLVGEIYLRVKKVQGIGFGDIKMMAMVGAFLGWQHTWLTIVLGSLFGALIGSFYIYFQEKGIKYELPFGSFLAVAAIISTLCGTQIISAYLGQF
ncbi:MAG: prepilin peptidase [Acidobacteriota bacterium]|nr:prepilin peptidase [Acidobacteriota bacterium]